MEQLSSSTDRLAWQSTREQGMGSGLNVYMDKQPAASNNRPLIKDYYLSEKYKDLLGVN